ncbi:MAG: hypothetical protein H7222_16625 [Methylotenera sp.]|nr:hypothetical protein [Oligoflexia bacterium]
MTTSPGIKAKHTPLVKVIRLLSWSALAVLALSPFVLGGHAEELLDDVPSLTAGEPPPPDPALEIPPLPPEAPVTAPLVTPPPVAVAPPPVAVAPPPVVATPVAPPAPAPPAAAAPTAAAKDTLPLIEAKTYNVVVLRHSRSGKIYLFDKKAEELPNVGRILLLKNGIEPIMAFRVMMSKSEKTQFAAKRVRLYKLEALPDNASYLAVEKIADYIPPPPTAQDQADLKELERPLSVQPPVAPPAAANPAPLPNANPALTAVAPPIAVAPAPQPSALPVEIPVAAAAKPPGPRVSPVIGPVAGAVDTTKQDLKANLEPGDEEQAKVNPEDESDPEAGQEIVDEDFNPNEHNKNWLTAQMGAFRNYQDVPKTRLLAGGGFRYGYDVAHTLYFKTSGKHDSLTLEGGLFLYKMVGYFNAGDAFTVLPLIGTARYNLFFGSSFGVFFYAGLMRNFILSQVNANDNQLAAIDSIIPAVGTGVIYEFGPHWNARFDLGYDTISAGVMIRF